MRYGLVMIGAAPSEPSVSTQAIADYIKADLPDENEAISALRAQAEIEVTRVSGRSILTQEFRMDLPSWPVLEQGCPAFDRSIFLPRNPVVSVASVKYYDEDDVLQTVAGSLYVVSSGYEPGFVFLRKNFTWPCVADRPDAIQITFTAGYGITTISTPPALNQALLLLCRHYYAGGNPNPVSDKVSDFDAAQSILIGQRVSGFIA